MKLVQSYSEQKHLAVLCADIFEYTRHMSVDQEQTHSNVKERFKIIAEIVKNNAGTIIRHQGDSLLITFEHARNAIYCAAEIQRSSHEHNFKLPLNNELLFRIGISFGGVICEDQEPYGYAVNVAKRLEELASPGGIYLSDFVYDAVGTSFPFPINFRGKIKVKSIEEGITVYEVLQYEPLSIMKSPGFKFNHPIDRSYLGSLSIMMLAISTVVLIISLVLLVVTLLNS